MITDAQAAEAQNKIVSLYRTVKNNPISFPFTQKMADDLHSVVRILTDGVQTPSKEDCMFRPVYVLLRYAILSYTDTDPDSLTPRG